MGYAMISRKIFGLVSAVLSLVVISVCALLLSAALKDPRCKNYDRDDPEMNRGSLYSFQTDFTSRRKETDFGRGRKPDYSVWENLEDYCINVVDNWLIASGLGIGFGIFQLILTGILIKSDFSDDPMGNSAWTWVWSIGHLVVAGAMTASLLTGISGEVNKYHPQVRQIGIVFCAVTGLNGVVAILLSALTCCYIRRTPKSESSSPRRANQKEPVRAYTRTDYIRKGTNDPVPEHTRLSRSPGSNRRY